MSDEDLRAIISKYQQKAFELFNTNIVLETQIEKLKEEVNVLSKEVEKSNKAKRAAKSTGDFE